jgi:UPF0042 nucleotide-binding protein
MSKLSVKIVSGLSGSGKSTALRTLEDEGFYCIDNLPAALLVPFTDMCEKRTDISRIAVGLDVRGHKFWEGVDRSLEELGRRAYDVEIIFLDASDDVLQRRYSETRRPHPLSRDGDVQSGIRIERQVTRELRLRSHKIIDTTHLNIHQLRELMREHVRIGEGKAGEGATSMVVRIQSFGYKYGLPMDSDLVFDVRFLPNPYFVPSLQALSGFDDEVHDFVLNQEEARDLVAKVTDLMHYLIPRYEKEGKYYLTVSIGCTGGRHRSVVLAEELHGRLEHGRVEIFHRDIEKG